MTKFNEQQQQAIDFYKGACGVVASAGSGKSTVLLNRIDNLVENHNIKQNEILAITFTNKTATELRSKLKKMGLSQVEVGTFHAVCLQILIKEGFDVRGKLVPEWKAEQWFKEIDPKPDMQDILGYIGYQKNYLRGYNDTFEYKDSNYTEVELREFYKMYEENKEDEGYYDFDDYLLMTLDILQKNKGKYTWDFVLVDEHQDSNLVQNKILAEICQSGNIFAVGDVRQCFPTGSQVNTENGYKSIEDLKVGDIVKVASGRGTSNKSKITEIMKKEYNGVLIKITTKSGKVIMATPEHEIFLNVLSENKHFVYLMYKESLGFRVGRSSNIAIIKGDYIENRNGYEKRLTDEGGEKVWLIDSYDTLEDSVYYEQYYSIKYGLPQYVFKNNQTKGMLSQENINKLFNNIETYSRGIKLLNDMDMYFDKPHFTPQPIVGVSDKRRMNFIMFGSHRESKGVQSDYIGYNHELTVNTVDDNFANIMFDKFKKGLSKQKNTKGLEYNVFRVSNGNQDYILNKVNEILNYDKNIELRQRAILTKDAKIKFELMPICNARKGMKIALFDNGEIKKEEIINIEKIQYNGFVYDLNIDMYRNYIVNDIVVHNCIYSFRAGNIEFFKNFEKYWDNPTIINMYTNYRSTNNIVQKSNNFIKPYFSDYSHYVDAEAFNKDDGEIELNTYLDEMDEAVGVVTKIKEMLDNGVKPDEIAILYRLNSQSVYIENELKNHNIEYDITNNASFFKRKEVDAIINILRLVLNPHDDGALETVFNFRTNPLKYFSNQLFEKVRRTSGMNNISLFEALTTTYFDKAWQTKNAKTFEEFINKLRLQNDKGVKVYSLIDNIVKIFNIDTYIEEKYSNQEEIDERKRSIEILKSFVKNNNLEQFINFVYSATTKKKAKKDAVKLMTAHASKGLEWDNTFVVGIKNGKFPHERADEVEEARLFYVAVTRAKKNLYVSEIGKGNKFIEQYFGGKDPDEEDVNPRK